MILLALLTVVTVLPAISDYTVLDIPVEFLSNNGTSVAHFRLLLKYSSLLQGNWQQKVKEELLGQSIDQSYHSGVIDHASLNLQRLRFHPGVILGEALISDDALKGRKGIEAHDAISRLLKTATISSPSSTKEENTFTTNKIDADFRYGGNHASSGGMDGLSDGASKTSRIEKTMYLYELDKQLFTTQLLSSLDSNPQRDSRYILAELMNIKASVNSVVNIQTSVEGEISMTEAERKKIETVNVAKKTDSEKNGIFSKEKYSDNNNGHNTRNTNANHKATPSNFNRNENRDFVLWDEKSVLPEFIRKKQRRKSVKMNNKNHKSACESDLDCDFDSDSEFVPPGDEDNLNHRLIIYQTRGVYTGGTLALQLLYERVRDLGYNALVCDEGSKDTKECSDPSRKYMHRIVFVRHVYVWVLYYLDSVLYC